MDPIAPNPTLRTDVVAAQSAPRPTAAPARVHFADVLAKTAGGLVRGAEQVMTSLPGGPLVALALRGGAPTPAAHTALNGIGTGAGGLPAGLSGGVSGGVSRSSAPEGPQATGTAGPGADAGGDGGIQSTLQQSQDMNLYFLQIQEEVNAQNRSFSALSNVLKAEHDTVKTAIGNIR